MDGGHDGQQQLELVDGPLKVALEPEAEDLEDDLEVVEEGEADLEGPLVLEEVLPRLLVGGVPEADGGGDGGVGDGDDHDADVVDGAGEEVAAELGREAVAVVLVDGDQLPVLVRAAVQYLLQKSIAMGNIFLSNNLTGTPKSRDITKLRNLIR